MGLVIDAIKVEGLSDQYSQRHVPTLTVASASTLTLLVSSTMLQMITGSVAGQIVKLPDATTLTIGHRFEIWNESTVNVTVNDDSSATLLLLTTKQRGVFILQDAGSSAGTWAFTASDQFANPTQLLVTYPGTGLTVNYTAGVARFNATTTLVSAGSILLGASITNGWVYVDIDGVVKSAASLPVNVMPLALFTTSGSAVTALLDERESIDQNTVWGVVGDIVSETYNRAASAGVLEKVARADHAHLNNALLNRAGVVTAGTFAGTPKKATVTFAVALPSATYAVNITGQDSRVFTYETRMTAGFVINTNADTALANDVSWEAVITGEAS